jgi:hypothetical protein
MVVCAKVTVTVCHMLLGLGANYASIQLDDPTVFQQASSTTDGMPLSSGCYEKSGWHAGALHTKCHISRIPLGNTPKHPDGHLQTEWTAFQPFSTCTCTIQHTDYQAGCGPHPQVKAPPHPTATEAWASLLSPVCQRALLIIHLDFIFD